MCGSADLLNFLEAEKQNQQPVMKVFISLSFRKLAQQALNSSKLRLRTWSRPFKMEPILAEHYTFSDHKYGELFQRCQIFL